RVQFDETSLLGVSQNMHLHGRAVMTTGAIPFEGQPFPLENMVDKRPTLFAYLCSLVHGVAGYRVENAFVVNAALLWLGLFSVFAAVRARLGLAAGLAAPLWLVAVPLTSVVATSAGFELLATVTLALATIAALGFVARPDEPRFAALLGCGALFAQSRYESLPAAVLLGLLAAFAARGRFVMTTRCRWALAAVPTLVAPLVLLADHARDPNFTPEAAGRALVSFANFADHVTPFLSALFSPSPDNAMPGIVAIVGVLSLGMRVRAGQASKGDLLVAAPAAAITLLVLAWFYSDAGDPTALRLFLPVAWLCALAPLALARALTRRGALLTLGLAVALAGLRIRDVALGRAFPTLDMAALTTALDGVVARLPGDPGRTLWVGAAAQHLIVKGHAAVSVRTFQRLGARVSQLQRQGDLGALYLVETPIDRDMEPAFGAPRELLQRYPSEVVERVGGKMPVTVHRLGR
ncbi:MAG: hypothetical protein VXY92_04960, partial [Planctomycetota bacterium]|nr:hypothetical protein [Planctomycetota bacterium]